MSSPDPQTTDHLDRDAKDFAIEFGGYLATAAERFMDEVNRSQESGDHEIDGEIWCGLQIAIHQFRKRAERAKA